MKVLYISGPAFLDLDLSLVKHLNASNDVYFIIDLYPKLRKATILNITEYIDKSAIISAKIYQDIAQFEDMIPLDKTFVINRSCNNPLALSNILLMFKLYRLIDKIKPDIIHFNNYIYFTQFYLFFNKYQKLISIHDPFPHTGDEKRFLSVTARITRFINKLCVKNYLLYNKIQIGQFRSFFKLYSKNIHSVNLSIYEYISKLVDKNNSKIRTCDIIFFGRMSPYKGLDSLVAALRILIKKYPDIRVIIAGSGDMGLTDDDYTFLNNNATIYNRFIPTDELANLLNTCKVVACPYKDATQSGVIMTSYSLSRSVVCSSVGGLVDMVQDAVTGILYPAGDNEMLALALEKVITDEDFRNTLEDNINKIYHKGEKSWLKVATELNAIYRTVVSVK